MAGTTFRTANEAETQTVETLPKGKEPSRGDESKATPPYIDYEQETGKPYLIEHYKLGDNWKDKMGGFSVEVGEIDNYLQEQIKSGQLAGDVGSIKNELLKIEKMTNVKDESRAVVKLGLMAEYVKFLNATKEIKSNYAKYNYE